MKLGFSNYNNGLLIKACGLMGTVLQDGHSMWAMRAERLEVSAGHPGPRQVEQQL